MKFVPVISPSLTEEGLSKVHILDESNRLLGVITVHECYQPKRLVFNGAGGLTADQLVYIAKHMREKADVE